MYSCTMNGKFLEILHKISYLSFSNDNYGETACLLIVTFIIILYIMILQNCAIVQCNEVSYALKKMSNIANEQFYLVIFKSTGKYISLVTLNPLQKIFRLIFEYETRRLSNSRKLKSILFALRNFYNFEQESVIIQVIQSLFTECLLFHHQNIHR